MIPEGGRLIANSTFPRTMKNSEAFKKHGSFVSSDCYTNAALLPEQFEITMDLSRKPPTPIQSTGASPCKPVWKSTGAGNTSYGAIYYEGVDEAGNTVFVNYRSKELLLGKPVRGSLANGDLSPYTVKSLNKARKYIEGTNGNSLCFVPLVSGT